MTGQEVAARAPRGNARRRWRGVVLALPATTSLAGCEIRPAPVAVVERGPFWVPGHWVPHGYWVPGHWR